MVFSPDCIDDEIAIKNGATAFQIKNFHKKILIRNHWAKENE